MPHFDGDGGSVHYQSWLTESPVAGIVFLHGFGEHSGLYDRLAQALNAARIDLWALDQIGHGRSDGERGVVGPIAAPVANGRRLTAIAREHDPDLPLFLAGHSLGGAVSATAVAQDAAPWAGVILSGTPVDAPAWAQEELGAGDDEGLSLDAADLSSDPWYLDALANDPLAFTESEGSPLDTLPAAWEILAERFADVPIPILFVHGELDPLAPVEGSRRWAQRLPDAELAEFAGAKHDVLNETVHAGVADAIVGWVLAHVPATRS